MSPILRWLSDLMRKRENKLPKPNPIIHLNYQNTHIINLFTQKLRFL